MVNSKWTKLSIWDDNIFSIFPDRHALVTERKINK